MKTFLKWLVLIPVAIVLLAFALANRHLVTVTLDPTGSSDISGFAITAPLFIILFLAGMVGVIFGGIATWFTQGKHRRAARLARNDADRLRNEADRLKADLRAVSQVRESSPGAALSPLALEKPRNAA